MKTKKFLILFLTLIFINPSNVFAQDCSKLDKLSKEYAECNANLIKKNAKNLKDKATIKIKKGKKKFNKLNLKEKLLKFKNSKSHKDFFEN
tara:strand:- start:595 stop:867 length:273 start_codon:yes stop_codon:yes gene_type:complete